MDKNSDISLFPSIKNIKPHWVWILYLKQVYGMPTNTSDVHTHGTHGSLTIYGLPMSITSMRRHMPLNGMWLHHAWLGNTSIFSVWQSVSNIVNLATVPTFGLFLMVFSIIEASPPRIFVYYVVTFWRSWGVCSMNIFLLHWIIYARSSSSSTITNVFRVPVKHLACGDTFIELYCILS